MRQKLCSLCFWQWLRLPHPRSHKYARYMEMTQNTQAPSMLWPRCARLSRCRLWCYSTRTLIIGFLFCILSFPHLHAQHKTALSFISVSDSINVLFSSSLDTAFIILPLFVFIVVTWAFKQPHLLLCYYNITVHKKHLGTNIPRCNTLFWNAVKTFEL